MKNEGKPVPRLELHFRQDPQRGPVLTKTCFVLDEDSIPQRTHCTDATRVQWRTGAMALMWFFIKSRLDRDQNWLPCEPNTLMGSVHESVNAKPEIKWHKRFVGERQLRELIALTTHLGKPMRRLNTERLPQDHILICIDGDDPVVDARELEKLAAGIEEQWTMAGDRKRVRSTESDVRERDSPAVTSNDRPQPHPAETILDIDLVGYTNIAYIVEENLGKDKGPEATSEINRQIQALIDVGLAAAGCRRVNKVEETTSDGSVLVKETGDGAILVLEQAVHAHIIAEAVHKAAQQHNATIRKPEAKRLFRMGAATRKISISDSEVAGVGIIEAVRFESSAHAGELVIDLNTFQLLPAELQSRYQAEEDVLEKDEWFRVRRCMMVTESPHRTRPLFREPASFRETVPHAFRLMDRRPD